MEILADARPVVVVGAGAAGLMAAIFASAGPRPVLVLQTGERIGQKILVSGGGRCNVLPVRAGADDFHTSGSRHTLRKILAGWPLAEVRRFFEDELKVPLQVEPETGKLFPLANRANVVVDALLARARQGGVKLRLGSRVVGVEREAGWSVRLESGEEVPAARVILATGGLSVPATGSDGVGFRLAQALGHTLAPLHPALVPLTGGSAGHRALAGLSLPVLLSTPDASGRGRFETCGGFLFTHRGYSGPAVLNLSHIPVRSTFLGGPRPSIWVRWTAADEAEWETTLQRAHGPLMRVLREYIPERLASQLLAELELTDLDGAQLTREARKRLVAALTHYPLPWNGHEGYKTAEVTAGGVLTADVDPVTMESRLAPGIHLCGEMLDAFGPIGGYNFLWAWVTGRAAGLGATRDGP